MENMGLNEIREKFLSFFETKGHLRLPSFSLVPQNDPSLLLINSGMAPLKPYFTGTEIPPRKRVTTCQKCIRTPDIDNVGKTARHGTFFEMLGNFSFGDYFKKEAITWAWEFFTDVLKIPADRLYVTIYQDDDEAFEIWTTEVGVPADRILRMGKEDNFWEHGTGPCGPCSEIHYDRGEKYGCGKPGCTVGCDCDRYIEVWNLVFTQFDRKSDGSYEKLDHPNIDTGMGLERLACVMQGVDNLFEVDTVRCILDEVCRLAKATYGKEYKDDVAIRIITDHIRSTVMMVGDGVIPSNEGRGYVLRRLLRRAARNGRMLGIEGAFLYQLAQLVIDTCGDAYPALKENQEYIKKIVRVEEERFASTIGQGMHLLMQIMQEHAGDAYTLPGDTAFKLHDTYGFPLDLTKEILAEKGIAIDEDGFRKAMDLQKKMAREALKHKGSSWSSGAVALPKACPPTEFVGYDQLQCEGEILYLIKPPKEENGTYTFEDAIGDDENLIVVTDRSPFYAESGGQTGDCGFIETENGRARILDTIKSDGKWLHLGIMEDGGFRRGDVCTLQVDRLNRLSTERNHSATHLLQKALQNVLGNHVHQAGSHVTPDRLRFDFNHTQALTKEELARIEDEVNDAIYEDLPVITRVMPVEEAKKLGAMALFGEKYGDEVRVVSMGDYSLEFCGGTHVKNTASIGMAKIVYEGAVAAGIRRIEMLTGSNARVFLLEREHILKELADGLKSAVPDIGNKIEAINAQYKAAVKELEELKRAIASGSAEKMLSDAIDVNGVKVVAARLDMLDGDGLRDTADGLRDKLGQDGVVVLASGLNDKVSIVAMAAKSVLAKGIHCGMLVKQAASVCGGGGGGRPDMAQAGGKETGKIDEMLKMVPDIIAAQLKGGK